MPIDFDGAFKALTGNDPFPWQRALYANHFDKGDIPASCNLPTGLGKTSVIAVWLLALANGARVPRRLVYVVNRRTVVDQTTTEVENLRKRLPEVPGVEAALWNLCSDRPKEPGATKDRPLAISTLRGQFADNREWSADPSRPAVICGTVDMIGSRLLFSGYGCGFKTRPLHAGFLGQDALIVHDEAHLEPAFQKLLEAIRDEQTREPAPLGEWTRLKVMELTATSRAGDVEPFRLSDEDYKNDTVKARVGAKKALHLHANTDGKLAEDVAARALKYKDSGRAVLVFVRKVDDVAKIVTRLKGQKVQQLTGTLRGLERDRMADPRKPDGCPIFARFLPKPKDNAPESERWKIEPAPGTVYLVCTSAGEVGVNISADHLVCDLSTFDSMAQRFGRVNRFGACPDTEVHVIYPKEFKDDDTGPRLWRTLGLLELLNGDASPSALTGLREKAIAEGASSAPATSDAVRALRDYVSANQGTDPRLGGFAPPPVILPVSDILFDAWALTTVHDLPGRPPVEPYLHGVEDDKQRETQVAWRAEVALFARTGVTEQQVGDLLDEFPLRPHELLRDRTDRVQDHLAELAKGRGDLPVWVLDPDDTVRVLKFADLAKENNKGYEVNLSARTVVLPPAAGGLTQTGTLDGKAAFDAAREYDVGGRFLPPSGVPLVRLVESVADEETSFKLAAPVLSPPADFSFGLAGQPERKRINEALPDPFPAMRVAFRIDLSTADEEPTDGPVAYLVLKPEAVKKRAPRPAAWPSLTGHREGVKGAADAICSRLNLPTDVATAAGLAGLWHDLGKGRAVWQRGAGNSPKCEAVAKTLHGRPPENLNGFRHELASLVDVTCDPAHSGTMGKQSPECRELLQHLIATHHGRGRPHFPAPEADDPERPDEAARAVVTETPQRFARLQRKCGRWGLAYLESLLRAADALDSKRIEETPIGASVPGGWGGAPVGFVVPAAVVRPAPSIRVNVDPTNPGQFFACCGLLELADRLWPGAEGWFDGGQFHVACGNGTLADLIHEAHTANFVLLDQDDIYSGRAELRGRFGLLRLDWWHELGGRPDTRDLKVWAGTMESYGIARAMQNALGHSEFQTTGLLDVGCIAYTPTGDKKEPYYFDARRGSNAHKRDVGFSPDTLSMTTVAFPAVELLCLVGLQRCAPARTAEVRIYDYFTWSDPLALMLLPAAVSGLMPHIGARGYRFENWFRTGQKKHKAFRSAVPISNKVPNE